MDAQRNEVTGIQIAATLVPSKEIVGDDVTDTKLLRQMAEAGESYLTTFSWCQEILDSYFGGGIGGIFAVFLFHIRPGQKTVDSWLWVMIGDVPPAYLPIADSTSPSEAYRTYVQGMNKWVELARKGQRGTAAEGVPPVNLPTTPDWAERVNQKLYGLSLTVHCIFEDAQRTGPALLQ